MPDLGRKYTCYSCHTKFYDLGKPVPLCPKCGADQRDAEEAPTYTPSRSRAAAARVAVVEEPPVDEEEVTPAAEPAEGEEEEDFAVAREEEPEDEEEEEEY
ncbi:MAG TPA: FYDLN acid domain-containing protein [Thermoanaerobaculia bacterium]|nr:FYDLN acid domain-containing protein [Thermoanaerobaculia bacterium]